MIERYKPVHRTFIKSGTGPKYTSILTHIRNVLHHTFFCSPQTFAVASRNVVEFLAIFERLKAREKIFLGIYDSAHIFLACEVAGTNSQDCKSSASET